MKYLSATYQKYKRFKQYKLYRIGKYLMLTVITVYILLLVFPQILFGYQMSSHNLSIYSNQPLDKNIFKILDSAQLKLKKSSLYDENLTHKIFLTNTFSQYAFLNPRARGSFANTTVGIGIITNKADVVNDFVLRDAEQDNQRPLSDVIAHETMHLLIVNKFGIRQSFMLSRWRVEGYCEYIAGNTTIGDAEGIRRWKKNPNDDSTYLYFKYQQMVKYLLDDEKINVEDLFTGEFDEKKLSEKVFEKISK